MPVVFPHAGKKHTVTDADFRRAWADFLREHDATTGQALPRLPSRKSLEELSARGYQLSLEYLLRTLLPTCKDTAQATKKFLEANSHIIEPTPERVINPVTGREVQGVRLLPEADSK